jgi:3-oxoadipate enol-lactonase
VIVPLAHDFQGPAGAPLLVLGSSLGTDRRMWQPQLAALTQTHRVLRYDHRGHGGSAGPAGPYRMDELAADVLALIDATGARQFSLAGLSLGAMVAMQVAALAGERVDRLALFCTSAYLPPPEGWLQRAVTVRAGGPAAIADGVLARWFTPGFPQAEPETVAAQREQLLAVDPEGYAGCCEAIATMDLRPLLPTISAPTLVVAGDHDQATPPPHAERIAAGIAAGHQPGRQPPQVELVPGAHLATVESADRCAALLLAHLSTH